MLVAVEPHALVGGVGLGREELALAVSLVSLPVADVDVAVGILHPTNALHLVVNPASATTHSNSNTVESLETGLSAAINKHKLT